MRNGQLSNKCALIRTVWGFHHALSTTDYLLLLFFFNLTFLCSLAFLGLSGVCDPFAGAPAIGDAVCFSIVSAGIVKTSKKKFEKVNPPWKQKGAKTKTKGSTHPQMSQRKFTLSHKTWIWGLKSHQSVGVALSLSCHLPPNRARFHSVSLCRRHTPRRYL